MTVSSTTTKAQYSGNGATTVFAVPFYFLQNADLLVVLRSSAGVETTQVLNSNYTVTGAGNENGGSITMTVAPATGTTLTILRNAAATQETDLLPNDRLPAESLETALDKLTMLSQQLEEEVGRSLKYPVTDSAVSPQIPTASTRANKFLTFDANGVPTTTVGVDSSLDVFVQAGAGAVARSVTSKLRDVVSPKDFGAVGDGVTDDTVALTNAMAAAGGRVVDGQGLTYKVTPNTIIDTLATAGVGYGPGKLWFCISSAIQNMKIIGAVSFGNPFLGKHLEINNIEIVGDCRFSAWYTTFQGIVVSGTVYFGGDLPPTRNWYGFYYNSFVNCNFTGATICDQRYGPVNLNYFQVCKFTSFLVTDTGTTGYDPSFLPAKSFHLNLFDSCEFYSSGIQGNDGNLYPFVIRDEANTDGVNRFISCYMEGNARGFYGPGLEVDNLHTSGFAQGTTIGGKSGANARLGYQSPLSGEGGYVARDLPNIYPNGPVATGGDWSILNSSGYPPCLTSNNMTVTVGTDATEPTGLGKYVQFAATAGFAEVRIDMALTPPTSSEIYSYAFIYKVIAGTFSIVDRAPNLSELYGTANIIRLNDGWVMATGHTKGRIILSDTNTYTVRISAISFGRGSGLVSPFAINKPLVDLSGGTSYVKDAINSSGLGIYSNQQLKTMNSAGGNYNFYTITLANFSGESLNLAANFSLASSGGGNRYFYRESVLMIDGAGTMQETNLHNKTDSNGTLSFVLSGSTITVRATTSEATNESGRMAIRAFGYGIGSSKVTIL